MSTSPGVNIHLAIFYTSASARLYSQQNTEDGRNRFFFVTRDRQAVRGEDVQRPVHGPPVKKVLLNKPIAVGFCILEISETDILYGERGNHRHACC